MHQRQQVIMHQRQEVAAGGEQLVHDNEPTMADTFGERYQNATVQYNSGQARMYEDGATIGSSYSGIGNGGTDSTWQPTSEDADIARTMLSLNGNR